MSYTHRQAIHPDHVSPGTRYDAELVAVLQYVFIAQRRHDIGKVASELNMEYQELYAFISGRRTMPITLLRKVTEITRDKIFFDAVFSGSKIRWSFADDKRQHSDDVVKESLDAVASVGKVASTLRAALGDGQVSGSEKTALMIAVREAMTELNDMLEVLGGKRS